jgi:hypothetical protein
LKILSAGEAIGVKMGAALAYERETASRWTNRGAQLGLSFGIGTAAIWRDRYGDSRGMNAVNPIPTREAAKDDIVDMYWSRSEDSARCSGAVLGNILASYSMSSGCLVGW